MHFCYTLLNIFLNFCFNLLGFILIAVWSSANVDPDSPVLLHKCQRHQALNSCLFMFKIDSKTRIHSDFIFLSLPTTLSYPPTLYSLSTVRTFIRTKLTLIGPWLCCKPLSSCPIQLGLRVQVVEFFLSVPAISQRPLSAQCAMLDSSRLCGYTSPFLCFIFALLFLFFCVLKCSLVASLDLFLFFLKSTAQCLSVYLCLPIINE